MQLSQRRLTVKLPCCAGLGISAGTVHSGGWCLETAGSKALSWITWLTRSPASPVCSFVPGLEILMSHVMSSPGTERPTMKGCGRSLPSATAANICTSCPSICAGNRAV